VSMPFLRSSLGITWGLFRAVTARMDFV